MPPYDACLLDVYETVLSFDQVRHLDLLAQRAGVPPDDFVAAADAWSGRVTDGRASFAEAMAAVLDGCGSDADPADLVALDRRLTRELAVLHPDTVPFLETLRAAGVRTAFVSNCNEHTRGLLDDLGLSCLVDELVLSFEVGVAKPDPKIYRIALDRLGAAPERAVLVDDQQAYCDAAVGLGMAAIRIDRRGGGDIASLAEWDGADWGDAP